jgi:hypothetical protein
MAEPKTRPTGASVADSISALDGGRRRADAVEPDALVRTLSDALRADHPRHRALARLEPPRLGRLG